MLPYFDASVTVPDGSHGGSPKLPEGFEGALLQGPNAKVIRDEFHRWHPAKMWRHAETLDRIVGETHAAFPSRSAAMIDLTLSTEDFELWIKSPAEWWPICESLRNAKRYLRVHLPAGVSSVSLFKQVVKRFRYTNFWIDPFVHGPSDGWQGHVRLAEYENVWLSSLGLVPLPESKWSEVSATEALNFLIGEVGAAKLVYASGLHWDEIAEGKDRPLREWFEQHAEFEDPERPLVLSRNAMAFLHQPPEEEEIL